MKIKLSLLLILVTASSFISSPAPSAKSGIKDLTVLKNVFTDEDFQSYLACKCSKPNVFPVKIKFAGKAYLLANPASNLQEVPLASINEDSAFVVKAFKVKEDDKIKIKIDYLDKKLQFMAKKTSSCCWSVRSFLARKAGEVKPELFTFK